MDAIRTAVCRPFARVLELGITAAVLLLPITAVPVSAATLGSAAGNMTCLTGTDTVAISAPGVPNRYAVPADGSNLITGWSTFGGSVTGQVALLVWRPTLTAGTYTLVGESPLVTPAAGPNSFDLTVAPAAPIPVQAGDVIGLRIEATATCFLLPGAAGDGMGSLTTAAPGATETFAASPLTMSLDVAATTGTSAPPPPPPTTCDGQSTDTNADCNGNGGDKPKDHSKEPTSPDKSKGDSGSSDNSNGGN